MSTRCGLAAAVALAAFGAAVVVDMALGFESERDDGLREVCKGSGRWREAGSMSGIALGDADVVADAAAASGLRRGGLMHLIGNTIARSE